MSGLTSYIVLAEEAGAAVERREAQYPALIEAGKISADQATREIRVWRAIAADWHWVVRLERREVEAATLEEKLAALEDSTRRAERALHKAFRAADSSVRDAWQREMPIAHIAERYGAAAAPFLAEWDRYWCFADLLKWYRRDLPSSDRPGIAHFVKRHVQLSQPVRAAA
ncbi:hypothetical protein [Sphingobium sp. CFD-2]|uniref:hypothetical protein n=1 Tax=Sphingobium sp. CFD-2 TaxID=2878542 RepID=UPI00214ADF31|nr:hypothetical protein [Sphingobium sp. CFD-2]